ncbi:hypothetical protein EVAR_89161_1 [Eumeta japonica]|uniref:Uncharacterized protein n=1 Tax=Eumeta variegata TaxID=151549 RepID=A0A4C1Z821_EUMVA|nr:hypothetical protein EVAR_89161_1 [Eumeta japonica]
MHDHRGGDPVPMAAAGCPIAAGAADQYLGVPETPASKRRERHNKVLGDVRLVRESSPRPRRSGISASRTKGRTDMYNATGIGIESGTRIEIESGTAIGITANDVFGRCEPSGSRRSPSPTDTRNLREVINTSPAFFGAAEFFVGRRIPDAERSVAISTISDSRAISAGDF